MFNTNQESVQYDDVTMTIKSSNYENVLALEKKEIIFTLSLQVSDVILDRRWILCSNDTFREQTLLDN